VYPDRCWYSLRDPEQVRRLVQEHLEAGRPVAELLVEVE
jgi:(2Fe-2S) ferredoxin